MEVCQYGPKCDMQNISHVLDTRLCVLPLEGSSGEAQRTHVGVPLAEAYPRHVSVAGRPAHP